MQNSQIEYVVFAYIFIDLRLSYWKMTAESYAFDFYQCF